MNKRDLAYKKDCGCTKHVIYDSPFSMFTLYPSVSNVGYLKHLIDPDKIISISTTSCTRHKINTLNNKIDKISNLINDNSYKGNKEILVNMRAQMLEYLEALKNEKNEKNYKIDDERAKKFWLNFSNLMKNVLYFHGLFLF